MPDPPLCSCHGEPMLWAKDKRCTTDGGYWRCAIKQRDYDRNYHAGPKGRERDRRYRNSPMGELNKKLNEMVRFRVRY